MRRELWHSFSAFGLLFATLFFAASLTPSLLPRSHLTQGLLSGFFLAVGYGIGVFSRWLWAYMELPRAGGHVCIAKFAAGTGCTIVAIIFLWQAARWQNSIRALMKLEPVETAYPLEVALIALAVFALLLVLARFFRMALGFVVTRVNRFLPRRVSHVIGVVAAVALFWSVINGVLFRVALGVADAFYQEFDKLIEPETKQPTDPLKTGSNASLLAWQELGRAGREFISSGPTRDDIGAFSGRGALEPVRVYVGLRSATALEVRAKLALEELKRVGGFERSAS